MADPEPATEIQLEAKRSRKGESQHQRYLPSNNELPYGCNPCRKFFNTRFGVKRHFKQCCLDYGEPNGAEWGDHLFCLASKQALKEAIGRPFYPDYYIAQPDGSRWMVWPTRSEWPRDEAELLRQNVEYRKRPDAYMWYVANEAKGRPADTTSKAKVEVEEEEGESSASEEHSSKDEKVSPYDKHVPEGDVALPREAHGRRSRHERSSGGRSYQSKAVRRKLVTDWEPEADIETSRKIHSVPRPPPGTVWIAEEY